MLDILPSSEGQSSPILQDAKGRSLENCPALILNADFRPLSYFPLSVWPWQEAVKAIFRDTVTVVSEYDRVIHSPTAEFKLPSVIALKEYVQTSHSPAFTRYNVFYVMRGTASIAAKPIKHHN